jgi:hypothetical protein
MRGLNTWQLQKFFMTSLVTRSRMAILVVKHGNFLFGWHFFVVFSFQMTTLVLKKDRAKVLRATRVAFIIWVKISH